MLNVPLHESTIEKAAPYSIWVVPQKYNRWRKKENSPSQKRYFSGLKNKSLFCREWNALENFGVRSDNGGFSSMPLLPGPEFFAFFSILIWKKMEHLTHIFIVPRRSTSAIQGQKKKSGDLIARRDVTFFLL